MRTDQLLIHSNKKLAESCLDDTIAAESYMGKLSAINRRIGFVTLVPSDEIIT